MSTNQVPFAPKFGLEVPMPSKFNADVVLKDKLSFAISTALAVGTTVNLTTATGNIVPITGSGTITSFGSTDNPGEQFELVFDGTVNIAYSSSMLTLGGTNMTLVAGDRIKVVAETSTVWRITDGNKVDGSPIVDNSLIYAIALG